MRGSFNLRARRDAANDRSTVQPQQRASRQRSLTCKCVQQSSGTNFRRRQVLASPILLGASAWLCNTESSAGAAVPATNLGFESRVSEFTLPNGLHFIVLERHNAPVVSCHTHARVGAYVEQEGSTGLAHLLEHMAFKGTARIGSKDWPQEQQLLQAQDEVFYELRELQQTAEASGRSSSRSARIQQLQDKLKQLKSDAEQLVVQNAFGSKLQEAGAVGLNAATTHDNTRYFVLLPANKLELWFALESERFIAPVFRELYTEKEVIAEERRARWENSPLGKFTAEYLMQALDNPYRRPVIGFADDFDRFGSHEVADFFKSYYHPANITISIVGDVDPGQVQQLAYKYFGTWSAAPGAVTLNSTVQQLAAEPLPRPLAAAVAAAGATKPQAAAAAAAGLVLPAPSISAAAAAAAGSSDYYAWSAGLQTASAMRSSSSSSYLASSSSNSNGTSQLRFRGEGGSAATAAAAAGGDGMFVQRTAAGPLLALGYYRPSVTGRTGTAMEVAADVLSGGRSSRLIKQLVLRNQCLSASCLPGYPGDLHPGLALVSAVPQSGGDLNRLASSLQQQLDQLAQDGPSAAELARVKAAARAGLLSALTSNGSMAGLLAAYHAVTGSWRGVLQELDDVETLTGPEVAGVVGKVFGEENRFTGVALPL